MYSQSVGGVRICREPMEEVVNEPHGAPRWCFKCRHVREFRYRVTQPTGFSYYGPNPSIRCGTCGLTDGDMFPGRSREWDD